jgi:hypothetical protein
MGYTITKVKYQSFFFSEYITFSINFNVGFLGGMTNIQTIFDIVRRCLKHVLVLPWPQRPLCGLSGVEGR